MAFPKTEENANVIHCIHEAAAESSIRVVAMPGASDTPILHAPDPPEGRVVGFKYRNMRGESRQVEQGTRMPERVAQMTAVIEASRPGEPTEEMEVALRYLAYRTPGEDRCQVVNVNGQDVHPVQQLYAMKAHKDLQTVG